MHNYYHFEPKVSLHPNQITFYNEVSKSVYNKETNRQELQSITKRKNITSNSMPANHFHGFDISSSAYRNLHRRIGWLYHLAKPRHVKTYSGKDIFSFKMAFITLTLPSKQKHPTSFITKNCLNQFLIEVRQRTGMQNYIWRLEFQKNGNVHYHLATDTYLDYFFMKSIWNRILNKYGYVDEYQKRHKGLSLSQYVANQKNTDKIPYEVFAKRYAKGCSEDWSNPPSVDVKSVINGKSIQFYLSKYFSKSSDENPNKNELDNAENSQGLRLWYCSSSLSKLKNLSYYVNEIRFDVLEMVKSIPNIRKVHLKYASVYYLKIGELKNHTRVFFEKLFRKYSTDCGYLPAT